jgi:hypothetical protein
VPVGTKGVFHPEEVEVWWVKLWKSGNMTSGFVSMADSYSVNIHGRYF